MLLLLLAGTAHAESRLVALGGAVTETVYALGEGATLVGTDQTSLFPGAARTLPKVGYLRALGAEGVLSLRPDTVIASADAGPPAALQQMQAAGVAVHLLPEAHGAAAALERVRRIGVLLHREPQAAAMLAAMQADLAQLRADLAAAGRTPACCSCSRPGAADRWPPAATPRPRR